MNYRWVVLATGTAAQAATSYFLGLAAVTPALREHFDVDVSGVGLLIGLASAGLIPTLIPWGGAADRFGERWVMAIGLTGAALALGGIALLDDPVAAGALLLLAGASGASVNAASGRAVLTWFRGSQARTSTQGFPREGRGTAMAIRQTAVPVGTGIAAVALPTIAERGGVPAVFAALAVTCLAAAVAVALLIREPPHLTGRQAAPESNTWAVLTDRNLQLLCVAGFLLVVPQFLGSVFMVELLHDGAGMALPLAGTLLALTQVLGALGRLGNGAWADRAGSMLGPLRIVAIAIGAGFALAAVARPGPVVLFAAVLVPAAALAISWNGLVFTSAGELAPPGRAATGMAMANTANYVAAAATPPIGGLVAEHAGWSAMLAVGAVAAVLAVVTLRGLNRSSARGAPQPVAEPSDE